MGEETYIHLRSGRATVPDGPGEVKQLEILKGQRDRGPGLGPEGTRREGV